jgi:CHAT domain
VNLGNAGVRLVVLGACNSASRDAGGAWSGVAPALVRENIPAVVAMQFKVLDQNAGLFMAHLYSGVLGGFTIDEAIFEGRQALFKRGGLEDRDWGVPVVYLRARDGVLFPLTKPTGIAAQSGGRGPLIQQHVREISGENFGADIEVALGLPSMTIEQDIGVIRSGGRNAGLRIGRLGPTPQTQDFEESAAIPEREAGLNKDWDAS